MNVQEDAWASKETLQLYVIGMSIREEKEMANLEIGHIAVLTKKYIIEIYFYFKDINTSQISGNKGE